MRFLLLIAGMAGVSGMAFGQWVAFTGKESNAPDEFAFVALSDLPNGTVIFFTNYDFDNGTGAFNTSTSEGTLQFTVAGGTITKGTVVQIQQDSPNTAGPYTVTNGGSSTAIHVSGQPVWAAVAADPHYAFAASNPVSPLNTVAEIYAYMDTDLDVAVGSSKDPTGLYPNAVMVDFSVIQPVAFDFTGNRVTATLADLKNPALFTTGSTFTLDLTSFSGSLPVELTSFSVE
ncbi:MAG: hypothetical protein KDC71_13600 [Acidobacteria bacterium]|nr:hypothetical protein [Acidobacteriota bacterium]